LPNSQQRPLPHYTTTCQNIPGAFFLHTAVT
jgi:hypothetical protein